MKKRYPRMLSSGANNIVIALNETEAAKIFSGDIRSDIGSEAEKMKFANAINDLVVQFVRLDDLEVEAEILVMQRLYPMDFRAFEVEKRETFFNLFEQQLQQLHQAGFVHRGLRRSSDLVRQPFDNIFLTDKGFRLIDVSIAALEQHVGERLFERFVAQEEKELEEFKKYFLSR